MDPAAPSDLRLLRRFLGSLGETTLLDLFGRYQIEERHRLGLLATTLTEVVDQAHPTDDLPALALQALEANCRAYVHGLLSFHERSARWAERSPS